MEDSAAAVKEKEQAHAQEMIDLERKLLTDKGNLQKVSGPVGWTNSLAVKKDEWVAG